MIITNTKLNIKICVRCGEKIELFVNPFEYLSRK